MYPSYIKDFHSTVVITNTHKSCLQKQPSCPYHRSWRTALEPKVRFTGSPACGTSLNGAKDARPKAFSNRLRICRLMYKPLPHGSCKLDPRHYRNRRLALTKKRAIKLTQTFAARRAIPQYFQKRIKHKLLARKSALPDNCSTKGAPSVCESSVANGEEILDASPLETQEIVLCDSNIPTKEADSNTLETHIDTDSSKAPTVVSPTRPSLDRVDAVKTIKEYYSIQCAIRLLLSMLQERMEEVETMQKTLIPASREQAVDKAAPVIVNDVETNVDRSTENDTKVKEVVVKNEPNRTPERIIKDFDPDKENNVPFASTVESMSPATVALNRVNSTPSKEEAKEDIKPYSFLESSKSDILDPSYTCDIELEPLENRKNLSIVDSLLNKFNLSPPVKATVPSSFSDNSMDAIDGRRSLRDRTKIAARPKYSEIPEESRKMRVSKVFGKLHKTLNIDLDCTNSNSSTEFYGFDEGEVVKLDKPSLPGLLPTPIVRKSQPFAPFLTYGSSIEAEQTKSENETRSDLFREEGLISFGSVPPRLECPQRPNDMVRPRTVAQKRILVQRENDIRYVMIDNESKIFHFLEKRSRNIDATLDFCRMKELQDQQIPFTHSTWRALAWLRTEKGHYYFQTMNIDNRTIRLSGCRGNHKLKSLSKSSLYSSPVIASRGHRYHYVSNCHCPPHPEGLILNISQGDAVNRKKKENEQSEQRMLPYDNSKYLYRGSSTNTGYQSKRSYPGTKPGPLSSKCLQPSLDEDPCLGPLEVFKMPKVELEVFPKINRPLDGYVKPYLKMILPHDDITENWARFAVSTLTAPKEETNEDKTLADENEERSFIFEVPYANDQRRILIRRRLLACPGAPINVDVGRFTKLMDEKLTFRKSIDEALERGERDQIDPDELVCADMLSAITDSVAIALAEDVFVKDDPDIEYVKKKDDFRAYHEQKSIPIKIETTEHGADVKTTSSNPSPQSAVTPNDVTSDADAMAAANGNGSECSKTIDPAKAKLLCIDAINVSPFPTSREMKRLNATIIEGPSEPTQSPSEPCRQQRCDPIYCSKGCLCDVLLSSQSVSVANIHRRQHCGQIDCVFGCTCGFAESSNITHHTKVEHAEDEDGETALSRAEQRYLREKATARLAKEEREFTPTVILTKNTTVLVQNKESECRRLKKKPKKYDDYYNDQSVQYLLNGGSVKDVSGYISKPPPNAKPLPEDERMRHAHVLLNKLPQLADIEPLCMVHDLYRCFCGGKATQGKPFSFTEDHCITIAPKSSGSDVSPSVNTSFEVTPSGRMTKVGSQTSAKTRTKDQEMAESTINGVSALVNVRKRLYSFEKPQGDRSEGKVMKTFQGPSHRRRRDSSEESYKPPYERKVAKKNSKTTTNDTPSGSYDGTIRARRASVAPGHIYARRESTMPRPTQPVAVVNKQLTLAMRRASVASPHLMLQKEYLQRSAKPANASSRRSEASEQNTADNSLYTIIKPTKANGSSKINNLILKRVTSQTAISEPTTAKQTTSMTKTASPIKTQSKKLNPSQDSVRTKQMSVRELRHLMVREFNESIAEEKNAPVANSSNIAVRVVNILLVDSEENIDNEPRLNIISEGTKKLVISGKRRTFVENIEFKNGYPPARTIQYRNRAVYVVQIATEDAVSETKSIKMSNYKTLRQHADSEDYSSSGSSPLNNASSRNHLKQFNIASTKSKPGQSLEGDGTTVEKTDRLLCSLMHHINELLRRENLDISPGKKGILHICRWKQLLSSFALGEIDVLDLKLTNGTEMTVITKNPSERQLIPNVKYQLSANRLTIDKMINFEQPSLLMKMIVCQVDNVKMNNLALVLYGNQNFWHFCGFLKANEKVFRSDSNVLSNPSKLASAKIKMRLKEYYKKMSPEVNKTVGTSVQNKLSTSPATVTSQSNKQTPSTVSLSTQSNIEILRKGHHQVHFPLGLLPGLPNNANGDSCRWMRLKIENDFSHMYLQSWQCCITYGTIKKAIYDSNRFSKPICLETPVPRDQLKTQLLPYVYALPKEGHALFLGPYKTTETKVDVILCQSVRDSLYEREVYERLQGIKPNSNTKRTSGWWVDAITSRVASVDMRGILTKVDAKKTNVPVASTAQRSLLKRNNISMAATSARSNETINMVKSAEKNRLDEVRSHDDSDSDDVVVLESNSNDDGTILSAKDTVMQVSTAINGQPPRKGFSVEHNAVDLLKLVQGTMRQNQQKKREIALSLELQRAATKTAQPSLGVNGLNEQSRKRSSTGEGSSGVDFVLPTKVPRRSAHFMENTSAKNQQQQHFSITSATSIMPNSTIASNAIRRQSVSGPQLLKTASRNSGTISITPLKTPETTVPVKVVQNTVRSSHTSNSQQPPERRMMPSSTIQSNSFRRLSLSDPQLMNIGTTITRNSGTLTITAVKSPETTTIQEKMTQNPARPSHTLNSQGSTQRNVSGRKITLPVKTNESTARAPIPRSRLNSVAVERFNRTPPTMLQVDEHEDDVVLLDDDDDDDEVDNGTAKTSSSTEIVPRLIHTASSVLSGIGAQAPGQKTLLSKEQLRLISRKLDLKKTGQQDGYNYNSAEGVLKISRSLLNTLQRDGILNQSVGNDLSSNGNVTAGSNSRSVSATSAVAANPSTAIAMPRMKVVPRVSTVSANRPSSNSGGTDISITAQSGTSGTNTGINLKYLSEEQKDRKILLQPHTRGVLESKIPGLGLVEAVRFNNQEVIINLKELTIKKQLVSVPNLEAAVTLLNQFIQRNTYAFKPLNLTIKWQFKERIIPLKPEEKLTNIISQCCIITPYGLVNLFKLEQIEMLGHTAPTLLDDVLILKLSVLCLDKKTYDEEKCYEYEDKIYEKALETIKSLEKKRSHLVRQVGNLGQLVKANKRKLRDLKQASTSTEPNHAATGGSQESVIVIDDD
ncbi:uncharacterized protein LOC125767522 isoform X2 [Anopheles funestus]|uniref:uncharacterized protein LOC125767522 isoform X2 n=1 Tax=Anopheles funestus TaxID=62324 RepID=UPI0020C5D4D8|nr:uncharacterized protein LOC125767522 isoform X2 [Anopheles funestus]